MMPLRAKRILLGVSGGIAAYKSVLVLRLLQTAGAQVRVVMTPAAQKFVQPLTFEALSHHRVYTELFPAEGDSDVIHVHLGQWADLNIVAPATADLIGRLANGLANDLLSCTLLATEAPVLLAPAMESQMWVHAGVQRNMSFLKDAGYSTVGPATGFLASGATGVGRMAEPGEVVNAAETLMRSSQEFVGRRIVVTAGRTEQPLDPVRFMTNRSTGKMGYAIAEHARRRGADVLLITGPSALDTPAGVEVERVRTVADLKDATTAAFDRADALVMTAAVLDFRPEHVSESKIKKRDGDLFLRFLPNEDFLVPLAQNKGERVVIGFAMETDNALENARKKLKKKNLDLIVLNELNVEGAGFGVDTNVVTFIEPDREDVALPLMSKHDVADRILDWLEKRWEVPRG
jgi:phosphopantothenoylcysteine decarboxylase/phosphopantothenate--cysteine ligase